MIDPNLAQLGLLAQAPVNSLSPPALAAGSAPGIAQIPTGTVTTEHEPSTEQKVMGGQTKAAMGDLDVASANEVEALKAQKEADIQKENASRQGAEAQADVAGEKEKALADLAKQQSEWRVKREAEREREFSDFMKAQKSTTIGNVEPIRQVISALAVGFGSYASSMNGGPNTAWEIFKEREENDRKLREAELKKHVERMAASGKNAEEMLKYFNQQHDSIEKLFAARNDVALKQMEALKATVPSAAAAADVGIAKAQERQAELKRNFVTNYDETVKNTGTSTQTSSGDKTGQNVRAPDPQKAAFGAAAEENRKKALELKKLKDAGMLPTPEELREIDNNKNKILASGEKEKHSPIESFLGQLKRDVKFLPSKFFPENYPEGKKRAYTLIWQLAEPAAIRETQSVGWMSNPEMSHAVLGMRIPQPDEAKEVADMKVDQLIDGTIAVADKIAKDSSLGIMDRKQDAIAARAAASQPPATTGKVGSSVHAKKIPESIQDAAVAAVDDYSAIKAAIKDKKIKETPNIFEAMNRVREAHQNGKNDASAAEYLRMVREREGI